MSENTDKLVVKSTGKLADVSMPDPTEEEILALDGREVSDTEGNEYTLRYRVNKDLGGNDAIKNIEAEQKSTPDSIYLGKGSEVSGKWDPNSYLTCLFEDYLTLVEKSDYFFAEKMAGRFDGKIYDEFSCFDDFAKDCLDHLKDQVELFRSKLKLNSIDVRQFNNAKYVMDMCTEVLVKFLAGDIKF
jgi:hypothetical protein